MALDGHGLASFSELGSSLQPVAELLHLDIAN